MPKVTPSICKECTTWACVFLESWSDRVHTLSVQHTRLRGCSQVPTEGLVQNETVRVSSEARCEAPRGADVQLLTFSTTPAWTVGGINLSWVTGLPAFRLEYHVPTEGFRKKSP